MKLFGGKTAEKAQAKATPSRRQWLALRPLRNPQLEWRDEDDTVILEIKRVKNWKTQMLNLLIPIPSEHTVELDRIGTDVWRLMDGTRTIGQIARDLAEQHQIEKREAEVSLQQFFKELGRRGYIGFAVESIPEAK